MKKLISTIAILSSLTVTSVIAQEAKSLKHAKKATENREAIFSLLGSNMGPLGAMAKGKMPFDAKAVEKYATRINQLSLMIADYSKTNTSKFDVKTEALDKIWGEPEAYAKRTQDLIDASAKLQAAALTGEVSVIKRAIGGVGKTCGGCHDDFRAD